MLLRTSWLLVITSSLIASTVTSTVSCEVGGIGVEPISVYSNSVCSASVINTYGEAARARAEVGGSAFGVWSDIVATSDATGSRALALSAASIRIETLLVTTGSLRDGLVELLFSGSGSCVDCAPDSIAAFDAQYRAEWGGHWGDCYGTYCHGVVTVPVMLGGDEVHKVMVSSSASGIGGMQSETWGRGTARVSVQFKELDGTPVDWLEYTPVSDNQVTPEPGTFVLIGIALIVLYSRKK